MAAATLELLRCERVHGHPEPYVRRAALLAAGQVLGAVPPARLATAMLGAAAGGAGGAPAVLPAAVAARDAADEALVSRLEWLRQWVESVAEQDTDDSCRRVLPWLAVASLAGGLWCFGAVMRSQAASLVAVLSKPGMHGCLERGQTQRAAAGKPWLAIAAGRARHPMHAHPPLLSPRCRMMAGGVQKLQGNLAAGALQALGSSQPASPLESGSLLPLPQAGGGGPVGLPSRGLRLPDIRLP